MNMTRFPGKQTGNWIFFSFFLFLFSGTPPLMGPGEVIWKLGHFFSSRPKNPSRASITNMNLSEATGLRSAQTSLNALDNNPPCRTSFVHQVSRFCPFCVRRRGRRQPRCCQLGIGGVLRHFEQIVLCSPTSQIQQIVLLPQMIGPLKETVLVFISETVTSFLQKSKFGREKNQVKKSTFLSSP